MAGESPNSIGQIYFIASKEIYGWKQVGQVTRAALGRGAVTLRIPEAGVYVVAAFAEFFSLFSSKPHSSISKKRGTWCRTTGPAIHRKRNATSATNRRSVSKKVCVIRSRGAERSGWLK